MPVFIMTGIDMKTKFDFGDLVVPIELKEIKKFVECSGCDSSGSIILKDGREHVCPVCNGSGKSRKVVGKKWSPVHSLFGSTMYKVSEIAMFDKIAEGEECYHLGDLYYEAENCFASDEEARAECERRNQNMLELSVGF